MSAALASRSSRAMLSSAALSVAPSKIGWGELLPPKRSHRARIAKPGGPAKIAMMTKRPSIVSTPVGHTHIALFARFASPVRDQAVNPRLEGLNRMGRLGVVAHGAARDDVLERVPHGVVSPVDAVIGHAAVKAAVLMRIARRTAAVMAIARSQLEKLGSGEGPFQPALFRLLRVSLENVIARGDSGFQATRKPDLRLPTTAAPSSLRKEMIAPNVRLVPAIAATADIGVPIPPKRSRDRYQSTTNSADGRRVEPASHSGWYLQTMQG